MRNHRIFAPVLATALLVSACGSAELASPSVGQSSAPSATPIPTVAEPACPYPDGAECRGPLAAGGPYKTNLFVPVFNYVVGEGWDNIGDFPGEYQIMRSLPDGRPSQSGIYLWRDVAISNANCEEVPEPGIGRAPADMAVYLRNHDGLTSTEPEAVNIGGLDGVAMEIALTDSWTKPCAFTEGQPTVPMFVSVGSIYDYAFDEGVFWGIGPGEQMRLYLLALPGGGTVLIDIDAFGEDADFDALREAAVPVVESITFDPNYY